jgi:NADPH2:quinone reductase
VALPAVIDNDVSGVVVETGPGAGDFQPGDEVWYLAPVFAGPGTYAEYHVVDQALVARKPASPHGCRTSRPPVSCSWA